MYNASSGFVAALRWGSSLVAARLTIYNNGVGTAVILPVSQGNFTVDRNSQQRSTGQLTVELLPTVPPQTVTFPDPNAGAVVPLIPLAPSSPLAPFGSEVFVELSVISPDMGQSGLPGANGWVPMGLFVITDSNVQDSNIDVVATLQLSDRSYPFSRWGLLANYNVPAAGGTFEAEVKALLAYVWNHNGPGQNGVAVPSWISSNAQFTGGSTWVCPAGTLNQGQDPWGACLEMAAGAGQQLFFDRNGILTSKPVPGGPAGALLNSLPVVWGFEPQAVSAIGTFAHALGGTPYTTPIGMGLHMTRNNVSNDFFVSATGAQNVAATSTPVMSEAKDSQPLSPTYVKGGIGDVPNFVFDALITTAGQALAEAQYNLGVSIASAWTVSVATPPNPVFDIDDVCTVTNPRLGLLNQKFIVDTISTSIRYDEHTNIQGRVIVPGV